MGEFGMFRYDIYATGMRLTPKAHRATGRLVATLLNGISKTGSEGRTRSAYWITGLDKLTAVQRCTFESGIREHYNNPVNLMPVRIAACRCRALCSAASGRDGRSSS